jgi:hypothetical protein
MKADRVLTINDYYDGPRLGVAELDGVPHIYEAEFDHSTEEYGDTYFLSPIGHELLKHVLEDWEIWCRWHRAHTQNQVDLTSHPALPQDRNRHEELKLLVGGQLRSDPLHRARYQGKFSTNEEHRGTWNGTLVEWVALSDA